MKYSKFFYRAFAIGLFSVILCGCNTKKLTQTYLNAETYDDDALDSMQQKSILYEGPCRNPVILIHGLLGSKIEDKNHRLIWGRFSYKGISEGDGFEQLAHPMAKGISLGQLHNGSHPSGLLDQSQVKILGVQFSLQNYDILVESLKKAGYVPETEPLPVGKNFPSLFIFSYDWRRDISENAAALHKFILEKRAMLQKQYGIVYRLENYDVQFDLVGHSMGGLVGRYYLRYGDKVLSDQGPLPKLDYAGARYVDKLIVVGTPNAGYADTLLEMTEGLHLVPRAPEYPPALLGTFLSYYEMLPDPELGCIRDAKTKKQIDLFDSKNWIKYQWGLADPKQDIWLQKLLPKLKTPEERRAVALDHLDKALNRAKRFKKAMSVHAKNYPPDVSVWLIAGHTVMTNAVLEVDEKGNIKCVEQMNGDGKVTYASACKDLRAGGYWSPFMLSPIDWKAIFLMQGGHMGIMKSNVFDARLRQLLLDVPTSQYREDAKRNIDLIQGNAE